MKIRENEVYVTKDGTLVWILFSRSYIASPTVYMDRKRRCYSEEGRCQGDNRGLDIESEYVWQ